MNYKLFFSIALFFLPFLLYPQIWEPVNQGINGTVYCMEVFNNQLYVGGLFSKAGAVTVSNIARWDGTDWYDVNFGTDGSILTMAVYKNELYVGGYFLKAGGQVLGSNGNIARWNGTNWNSVTSSGTDNGVSTLTVFSNYLYAGGEFTSAGGAPTNHIAKWDGTSWTAVGGGVNYDGFVQTITVHNNSLYAAGYFNTAGSTSVNNIARLNSSGSNWIALSSGVNSSVNILYSFGTKLYVGGNFTSAGGKNIKYISTWDGTKWDSISGALNNSVWSFSTYNSYYKTNLYVGGIFTKTGSSDLKNIGMLEMGNWYDKDGGTNGAVYAIKEFNSELYMGGAFSIAGNDSAMGIARLINCPYSQFNYTINLGEVNFNNISLYSDSWYWDFGDGNNSTLKSPINIYINSNTFIVKLIAKLSTNIECIADTTVDTLNVNTTGINENFNFFNGISILNYENKILINNIQNTLENLQLEVYDITGKEIYKINSKTSSCILLKNSFSKGLYFVRIKNSQGDYYRKIFID